MKIRTQLLALGITGIALILSVGAQSIYTKRKVDVAGISKYLIIFNFLYFDAARR